MRIFKADMFHLFKDKLFYLLLILTSLLPFLTCIVTNSIGTNKMGLDSFVFQGLSADIICVIIGIQVSSFIGREYQNNTIRNKICYGERKNKVAMVFFLDTVVISLSFIITSILSSFIFGFIFCDHLISAHFLPKLLCQILIIISFSICVTSIVVICKNMKAGFVFVVLISIILGAVSYVFPLAASNNQFMAFLSRILYMVVSNMLLKSNCGAYQTSSYTFNHLYINAILIALIYFAISTFICLLIVRKQEYK
ncbi:MAG: ABC transporter permease [Bacilli bacterium]